jgi:hypothetical protein
MPALLEDEQMTTTTAEQISAIFDDDGSRATGRDGRKLLDVIEAHSPTTSRSDDRSATRYDFADGSAIIVAGGAWDLGIDGCSCHCWRGGGHVDDCHEAE